MAATRKRSTGFSMLEVLLTIFIVTVGLLGLVGMQVIAQEQEFESYQRAQALVLMNDVLDRINSNRKAAACYAITTNSGTGSPYLGTAGAGKYDVGAYSCPSLVTNPTAQARAGLDLAFIDELLLGASETNTASAAKIGSVVGARGCIGFDAATQSYSVAIAWQGQSATFSPASWASAPDFAKNCAKDLYGTDTQRRVVWTTLLIANLSA